MDLGLSTLQAILGVQHETLCEQQFENSTA
jgi:hypothetical protein